MSNRALLRALKKTITELITEIKNNIFTNPDDYTEMILVEFFFAKLTHEELMDHTIKHVLPYKRMIEEKNQQFFIKGKNCIFAGLGEEKIKKFSMICEKPQSEGGLSDENKETLWQYFLTILRITEEYKKLG